VERSDGTGLRYLVEDVTTNAVVLFGCDPMWVPQSPTIRSILEPLVAAGSLASFDNPGIVNPDEWLVERPPAVDRPARIGRFSADDPLKFPATMDDFLAVYPESDDLTIRMLGAQGAVAQLLGDSPRPENWTLLGDHEVSVKEFLGEVDFFVYFDDPSGIEAFGRPILEALASGAVVILPEKYVGTFREAAIYASPDDAVDVVRRLHLDPPGCATQVQLAHKVIADLFSYEMFADCVRSSLASDG
jgi:glycosyltransferase involved in cell wall biosynthesis